MNINTHKTIQLALCLSLPLGVYLPAQLFELAHRLAQKQDQTRHLLESALQKVPPTGAEGALYMAQTIDQFALLGATLVGLILLGHLGKKRFIQHNPFKSWTFSPMTEGQKKGLLELALLGHLLFALLWGAGTLACMFSLTGQVGSMLTTARQLQAQMDPAATQVLTRFVFGELLQASALGIVLLMGMLLVHQARKALKALLSPAPLVLTEVNA